MFEQSLYGAVNVIRCEDAVVEATVEQLGELAESLLVNGQPLTVFDMSKTPLIDSAGLEALLDIKDAFEGRGGKLKLANPLPLCSDILEISGVGKQFEIFERVPDAVGSFSR